MINQAPIDTDAVLADLAALREIGRDRTGVHRPAYSTQDMDARRWLAERMKAAGLVVQVDGVGNVFGRDPDASRALLLGSHSDTVPHGGWLDGALGVIYALHAAKACRERGIGGAIGIDVVSFADEEGTFVGCMGSRAFCGGLPAGEIDGASCGGVPLRQALADAGLDGVAAAFDPARTIGYFEAHIEQGPRLESAGVDIGVVEGIVGLRRYTVTFRGRADHAGTTPMAMRADAAAAMFAFANEVRAAFARDASPSSVWNIGMVRVAPGAANVVPSEAELVLEFRDLAGSELERMTRTALDLVAAADGRDGVSAAASAAGALEPAPMDARLIRRIEEAARECGASSTRLGSGAGHDAMILAAHVPAGMLFVPSIGGRSHDIAEDTSEDDIRRGAEVFAATVFGILRDGGI